MSEVIEPDSTDNEAEDEPEATLVWESGRDVLGAGGDSDIRMREASAAPTPTGLTGMKRARRIPHRPDEQDFINSSMMFTQMQTGLWKSEEVLALGEEVWFCPQDLSENLSCLCAKLKPGGIWLGVSQWGRHLTEVSLEAWWYCYWRRQWNQRQAPYCMLSLGWNNMHYTSMVVCRAHIMGRDCAGPKSAPFAICTMNSGERYGTPSDEKLVAFCTVVAWCLAMDLNVAEASSAGAGGQGAGVRVDVGDETAITALARASHVRLESVQQQDVLNNCAFHQEMQLRSAVQAIGKGGKVSKTWPWTWDGKAGRLELGEGTYGGSEDDAQKMRAALQKEARPAMKPIKSGSRGKSGSKHVAVKMEKA